VQKVKPIKVAKNMKLNYSNAIISYTLD